MNSICRRQTIFSILFFLILLSCRAFELDSFFTDQPPNINKDVLLRSNYLQCKYPYELILYDRKVKILGFSIKEVIFRFSKGDKFRSAEIILDYNNMRKLEATGYKRIKDVDEQVSRKISSLLKCQPKISHYKFPNGRVFSIKKWFNENYRFQVFCSLTENKNLFSVVFLRITPALEPEIPFQTIIQTKRNAPIRQRFGGDNILILPFRSQLPNTRGGDFTTVARILNNMGSEVNSLTLKIIWDRPDNPKKGVRSNPEKVIGYKCSSISINDRGNLESSCVTFISRYNEQAKRMNLPQIGLKENGTRWDDNMGILHSEVLSRVNLDFVNRNNLNAYKKTIIQKIDEGCPVWWFVVRCKGGAHARAIIGYNLKDDIIYYSDSWSAKQEIKKMSFLSAYLMTRILKFYTYK